MSYDYSENIQIDYFRIIYDKFLKNYTRILNATEKRKRYRYERANDH